METKNTAQLPPLETEYQLLITEILRKLLADFRLDLLRELRMALHEKTVPQQKQWLKSAEVKKLLGISHGTLQTLRNKGTIPFTKIGGVIYYNSQDIAVMMNKHKYESF